MKYLKFILIIFVIIGCEQDVSINQTSSNSLINGSGNFNFEFNKLIDLNIFYNIPQNLHTQSPILFVLHGAGRNASDYRDQFISKSNQLGFIVIAPEFKNEDFPGGDGYNLANIFVDGDNPSLLSLNDETDWLFSVFNPLFEQVKLLTDNYSNGFDLFGHSAGSQVAHRYLLFETNAKVNRAVFSAAGWYTVPDLNIQFPYGLNQGPFIYNNSLLSEFFSRQINIIVGQNDDDPNAANLRHTYESELQGAHRLERAQHFFNESYNVSSSIPCVFNWEFYIVTGAGHNSSPMSSFASDLLYN